VKAHKVVRRRGFHIFLDNRLTDGGVVISLTSRPPFVSQEDSSRFNLETNIVKLCFSKYFFVVCFRIYVVSSYNFEDL
jgi:hypothetical protein